AGSHLGALSYAFGAPILLQYGNPCFLAGAAWIPWAFCAIDRLLRLRAATLGVLGDPRPTRRGGAAVGAVLGLQVLGGDPGAAYLTVVCGASYALVLAIHAHDRPARLATWPAVLGAVGLWVAASLGLASAPIPWPGFVAGNGLILAAWAAV